MNKVFISKAERLANLKVLPQSILPSTLKHRTLLSNISQITLEHRNMAKECGPAFQFFRKFAPDIRFWNPSLKFERLQSPSGPLIVQMLVYKNRTQQPTVIEVGKYKSIEDLRERILQINAEL